MKPGDKVVCIDGIFKDWVKKIYTALPFEGVQYVVRANVGGVTHEGGRRPSDVILLVGLINPISEASGQEFGFHPKRFRLLEELKQEVKKKKECFA